MKFSTTMKLSITALLAGLLLGSAQTFAVPYVSLTIEDLTDATTETFFDNATPGSIGASTTNSALLAKYWGTGSIQTAISNNFDPSHPGHLISASINLGAAQITGTNLSVNILATEYRNPVNGTYNFETTVNAATIADASYDATVLVNADTLLTVIDVSNTLTYQATAPFAVGSDYALGHAFRLTSNQPGADLGFDVSTRAIEGAIPEPTPLALLAMGLLGVTAVGKASKA